MTSTGFFRQLLHFMANVHVIIIYFRTSSATPHLTFEFHSFVHSNLVYLCLISKTMHKIGSRKKKNVFTCPFLNNNIRNSRYRWPSPFFLFIFFKKKFDDTYLDISVICLIICFKYKNTFKKNYELF